MIEQLIKSLSQWESSTIEQVWSALNEKLIKKIDTRKWKSIDLAKLIGWDQVDGFFTYLAQNKCHWVVNLAAGDGLAIGDDPINAVLKSFNNPVCQQLADLGIHYVSMLEDAGIEITKAEVESALENLKQQTTLSQQKHQWMQDGAVRWNAFVAAVDAYQSGPKPEL